MSRILVVDDMLVSRESLARLLQQKGHVTDLARNGAEALVKLKQNKPDLIVLDQMMPEVDGLTFLAGIRRFPKYKELAVIMLTGVVDRSCHMKAQALNVKECLAKAQMNGTQLIDLIQKHLPRETPQLAAVVA